MNSNNQKDTIFVSDLLPDVTEDQIIKEFSKYGQVEWATIRVLKDFKNRDLRVFGRVKFSNPASAKQVLEAAKFNSLLLDQHPINVMYYEPDPNRRSCGNVFVKIPKTYDRKALYKTFGSNYHIISCKIAKDKVGLSKGYGWIQLETDELADDFVKRFSEVQGLDGQKIHAAKYIPYKIRERERENESAKIFTTLYVRNFDENFNDDQLKEKFEKYGQIKFHKIMGVEGKRFGIVDFEKHEHAQNAINDFHNRKNVGDKVLYVARKLTRNELKRQYTENRAKNLYFKIFDKTYDNDKVREIFKKFGKITSFVIKEESNFGFVSFENIEDAKNAMNTLRQNGKSLYVNFVLTKNELYQQTKDRNLFVENLNDDIDDDRLGEIFSTYGTVISAKVMPSKNINGKRFGYVSFSSQKDAQRAKNELNLNSIYGKPLYVSLFLRREDRLKLKKESADYRRKFQSNFSGYGTDYSSMGSGYAPRGMIPSGYNVPTLAYLPTGVLPAAYDNRYGRHIIQPTQGIQNGQFDYGTTMAVPMQPEH